MKPIDIPAGERVRILRRFSSSIPATYTFDVEPLHGTEVSGSVEVAGSRWLLRKEPVVTALARSVTVQKGFWDTLYSVYVTPDQDVRITFR